MKKKIAISLILCIVGFGNHVYGKWSAVNGPYGANVTALAKEGNNIYAGTNGGGMFCSVDNEITWIVKNAGLTDLHITAIAIKDKNVFIGTKNGVFLSQDSGTSWYDISSELKLLNEYGLHTYKSIFKLWFSNDTLFTWAFSDFKTCLGPLNAFFYSLDNGATWRSISNTFLLPGNNLDSLPIPDSIIGTNAILKNGNTLIYGTQEGIYLSQDNGATWTPSNEGISCADLSLIASNAGEIFVCSKRNTFIVNRDGTSWAQKNNNLPHTGVNCLLSMKNVMFAGTDSGVYALADSSMNWEPLISLSSALKYFTLFSNGNKLFATGGKSYYPYSTFFVSNSLGRSWDTITLDSSNYGPSSFVANGESLFAFIYDYYMGGSDFYKSSDSGYSWARAPFRARGFVAAVSCNRNLIGLSHGYTQFSETCPSVFFPGIYLLKPSDTAWTQMDSLSDKTLQNLASLNGNLFAATGDGVYLAPDSGSPWTDINDGLGDRNVRALAFSDMEIFAATEAGLWHRPLSEIPLGTIHKMRLPSKTLETGLIGNKIFRYTLPRESFVSLKIYDIAGRLVCSAINKKQSGGIYSLELPIGNLRSGNYIYKFVAGEHQIQNKFVILR